MVYQKLYNKLLTINKTFKKLVNLSNAKIPRISVYQF